MSGNPSSAGSKRPYLPSIPRSMPPQSRLPLYLGVAALAVGGYYYYTSGGEREVAKKQVQHDAAHAQSRRSQDAPTARKDTEYSVEAKLAQAGSKVDRAVEEGKTRIHQASQQLEKKREEVTQPILEKIDETDKRVEQKASEAKGGISSWFGLGGKK